MLGCGREELRGKTLRDLLWSNHCRAADAVAAILERVRMTSVELRVRCKNGQAKRLRLHRRYDKHERMMYIVADDPPGGPAAAPDGTAERRAAVRAPA